MAVSFGRKGGAAGLRSQSQRKVASSGSVLQDLLQEERERENRALQEQKPGAPVQSASSGKPKVYLEVAIFRGSFFGVDHQETLEFEMYPKIAPQAVQDFLQACAAGSFRDRSFVSFTAESVMVPGLELSKEIVGDKSMLHDAAGLLSAPCRGSGAVLLTLQPARGLDRHHVVFGKLLSGTKFLDKIEGCRPVAGEAVREARIVGCGECLTASTASGTHSAIWWLTAT